MTLDSRDARARRAAADLARLRAAVLAMFLEQVDAAAWRAYDAIRQLPGYCDLDEADALQVLRAVRWVFVTLITCLQEERQLTGREVTRLHDFGAAQARLGIPFEVFREAFATGLGQTAVCLRALARGLGDDGRGADTIVHDLMGSLADAANVREDGFAKVAGDLDSPEAVRRDEAGVPGARAGRRPGAARHG